MLLDKTINQEMVKRSPKSQVNKTSGSEEDEIPYESTKSRPRLSDAELAETIFAKGEKLRNFWVLVEDDMVKWLKETMSPKEANQYMDRLIKQTEIEHNLVKLRSKEGKLTFKEKEELLSGLEWLNDRRRKNSDEPLHEEDYVEATLRDLKKNIAAEVRQNETINQGESTKPTKKKDSETNAKQKLEEIPIALIHTNSRTKYSVEANVPREVLEAIDARSNQSLYYGIEGNERILFKPATSQETQEKVTLTERKGAFVVVIPSVARSRIGIQKGTLMHLKLDANREYFVLEKTQIKDEELVKILAGNLRK